jgi:hypothetical protein
MKLTKISILLLMLLFTFTCDEPTKNTVLPEENIITCDDCGVCDTDPINNNITCTDCSGELYGDYENDECNVCNNYTSTNGIQPELPYGNCDCKGKTIQIDSLGISIGHARLDDCNVCNLGIIIGEPFGFIDIDCEDCNGDLGGDAYKDGCNVCVGGNTGIEEPCELDCKNKIIITDGNCSDFSDDKVSCNNTPGCTYESGADCLPISYAYFDECGKCVYEPDENCMQVCDCQWSNEAQIPIDYPLCIALQNCQSECNISDNSECILIESAYYCIEYENWNDIDCAGKCAHGTPKNNDYFMYCSTTGATYTESNYENACEFCIDNLEGECLPFDPDINSDAYLDDCGVCSGGVTGHGENSDKDCNDICFGDNIIDECGICGGTGIPEGTCDCDETMPEENHDCDGNCIIEIDCTGVCGGDSTVDNCGTCDNDSSNDCLADCAGELGGSAILDDCDICSGGATNHTANSDQDCNGDCNGTASIDDCDICSGGATNHTANSDQDCNGNCNGTAFTDDCGDCSGGLSGNDLNSGCVQDCNGDWDGSASIDCSGECSGGDTGVIAYTICDCFDTNADNFWCTIDYTIINGSCATFFDNCQGDCLDGNDSYYNPCSSLGVEGDNECDDNSLFFNTGCEYYGCIDPDAPNYNSNATNCEDGTTSCCSYTNYLKIQNIDTENNTFEIYMDNSVEVGGFQLNFSNVALTGASSGTAAANGFMVSASNTTALGVSLAGDIIPLGSDLLTSLTFNNSTNICITSIIISNVSGDEMIFSIHHDSLCE